MHSTARIHQPTTNSHEHPKPPTHTWKHTTLTSRLRTASFSDCWLSQIPFFTQIPDPRCIFWVFFACYFFWTSLFQHRRCRKDKQRIPVLHLVRSCFCMSLRPVEFTFLNLKQVPRRSMTTLVLSLSVASLNSNQLFLSFSLSLSATFCLLTELCSVRDWCGKQILPKIILLDGASSKVKWNRRRLRM
jgi:hypothetical protein